MDRGQEEQLCTWFVPCAQTLSKHYLDLLVMMTCEHALVCKHVFELNRTVCLEIDNHFMEVPKMQCLNSIFEVRNMKYMAFIIFFVVADG